MAEHIARIMLVLREQGKTVRVTFIDDDVVTRANVPRQRFCEAEIGAPKAAALALRYNAAWGLDISAIIARFNPAMVTNTNGYGTLTLLVGCVDNSEARASIAQVLQQNHNAPFPRSWWLDAGNFEDAGQVILGCEAREAHLRDMFTSPGICNRLPSPALIQPDLLVPQPEERRAHDLSCAQMAAANAQSLVINQAMAMIMTQYLVALLLTGALRHFATYVNLPAGSMRSLYVTPQSVATALKRPRTWMRIPAKGDATSQPAGEAIEDDEDFDGEEE